MGHITINITKVKVYVYSLVSHKMLYHTTLQFPKYIPDILNKFRAKHVIACKTGTRRCMSSRKLRLAEWPPLLSPLCSNKSDGNRPRIVRVGIRTPAIQS